MITLTREEAQQVLDVIERNIVGVPRYKATELLRARLSAPQREWQGLTDEDTRKLFRQSRQPGGAVCRSPEQIFAQHCRAIEAKLRDKNA